MHIKINSVVSFHYTLTNNEGAVLDSSTGGAAFSYLQGAQMIVPGLERQMEGRSKGDKFKAVVQPELGYGVVEAQLIQRVPKERFGDQQVEEGMQFQAGEHGVVTVREVTADAVVVDGNHPLAGVTLNFEVEVTEVREATPEELAHGHVHGEGGHHH
jgi:FKBP-type peptidyl-prolyl cis-trans isomerase SlyD